MMSRRLSLTGHRRESRSRSASSEDGKEGDPGVNSDLEWDLPNLRTVGMLAVYFTKLPSNTYVHCVHVGNNYLSSSVQAFTASTNVQSVECVNMNGIYCLFRYFTAYVR